MVIVFDNVTKTYTMGPNSFQALKGVSFQIEKGELVAIIGASGSGKTTTMNILGLLDKSTSGRYLLEGEDPKNHTLDELAMLRNKKIGFVFQAFFLLPRLNALQNVGLPLQYGHTTPEEIYKRSMAMLEKVGMAKFAMHRSNELSGGQKQRVAIARALVGQPPILLADEPTGALDSATTDVILNLMFELHREYGSTVIIITHNPEVAQRCPRIIEIRDGLIISDRKQTST